MRWPGSRSPTSGGIGQRRSGRRSSTRCTRAPSRCGARPRRVVSTSGSSGMAAAWGRPGSRARRTPLANVKRRRAIRHRRVAIDPRSSHDWRRTPPPEYSHAMPASLLDFLAGGLVQSGFWGLFAFFLVVTQLTIFTVTLYLHRSQTHRGVDFHPVLAHFFRFWGWLTTSMITKEWVAIHRKHHARCETEEDPHSPMHKGIK